jgi:hypothetical protein
MFTLSMLPSNIPVSEEMAHKLLDWIVKRRHKSLFSRISVSRELVQSRRDKSFYLAVVRSMESVNLWMIFFRAE